MEEPTTQVLNPDQVEWIGVRFLDLVGRVFKHDGSYYRAIYPESVDKWDQIASVLGQLPGGLFAPVGETDVVLPGYAKVLRSSAPTFAIEATSWPLEMLQQAALKWVQINEELLAFGMGLQDAHVANVALFDGCNPMWVDHGSVAKLTDNHLGLQEFIVRQLNPLLVASKDRRLTRIARLMVKTGVTPDEALALRARRYPSRLLSFLITSKHLIARAFRRLTRLRGRWFRRLTLRLFRRRLASLNFHHSSRPWASYSDRISSVDGSTLSRSFKDPRDAMIVKLLTERNPDTVLDVGANDGYYSALALIATEATVLAVDPDEAAIGKMSKWVRKGEEEFRSRGVCCVGTFQDIAFQADLVLALALVHHLAITGMYKFDYIAGRLAEMSRQSLIVEFMPNGMGGAEGPAPFPLPAHYKLEVLLDELSRHFESVQVVDYDRPPSYSPRTLIMCDGRK